jgi:DNA-binding XRE family transcriptional regulator
MKNQTKQDRKQISPPRQNRRGGLFIVDSSQHLINVYVTFGIFVKSQREKLQLTQDELSRKAGIDRSYLSNIELGKRRISLDIALKLSQILSISIDKLKT